MKKSEKAMKKEYRTENMTDIRYAEEQAADNKTSLLRKSGIRIAGAVLTGTLVISSGLPVFAETLQNSEEKVQEAESEQQKTTAVFLNTESGSDSASGLSADQAVQTADKAAEILKSLALKDVKLTSDSAKEIKASADSEEKAASAELILVLCDSAELTEEQTEKIRETGASVMSEESYKEYLEQKDKKESDSDESSSSDEQDPSDSLIPETQDNEEDDSPFIWNQPQVVLPSEYADDTGSTDAADSAESGSSDTGSTSGILLPGFSMESVSQTDSDSDTSVQDAATEEQITDTDETVQQTDSESEELTEEEMPVYNLFAAFALPGEETTLAAYSADDDQTTETSTETAAADQTNQLLEDETTEEETSAVFLALPGRDLVGSGTSSVGSSTSSASTSTGSTSSASASSGSSSSASASSGSSSSASASSGSAASSGSSTSGNTSSGSTASAASGSTSAGNASSSGTKIIATGDTSNRTVWGLTAGISAAMAAFLAALWKKFGKA